MCFWLVACDTQSSSKEDYQLTLADGKTIDLRTEVYKEVPSFASYKMTLGFELGIFPDSEFAKRYQTALDVDVYHDLATLWRTDFFAYESNIAPTLWFYNEENDSVPCNFLGSLELIEDEAHRVVWSQNNIQFCNGDYPKSAWAPSSPLFNITIPTKELKTAPASYTLKLFMRNELGTNVELTKVLKIKAKQTIEQLVARSKTAAKATDGLQLFLTTSTEITQWSTQSIADENWADIRQKTAVSKVAPASSIFATVVVSNVGVDYSGQSNVIANYTLYDGSAVALLRARAVPVWNGNKIEKGFIRLAQNPLALQLPQRNTDRYFIDAEVYDLVRGSISELTGEITVVK